MKRPLTLVFITFFAWSGLVAQAPANDDFCGAVNLTLGTAVSGTTLNATTTCISGCTSCPSSTPDDDVWYRYAPPTGCCVVSYTLTMSNVQFSGGATGAVVEQRTGFFFSDPCTANGTFIACNAGASPSMTFNVGGGSTDAIFFKAYTQDGAGTMTFDLTLTCNTPPGVNQQPLSQSVSAGSSVTLVALPQSSLSTTIQWRKNGVDIPGATTPGLTINPVQLGDAGSYDAVFSNACGTTTTTAAVLTVNCPAVSISISENSGGIPNDGTVCQGDYVTLTASGGVSYAWSNNTSQPFITVNPAATTTYSVTATDNGCTGIASQQIIVNTVAASISISENSGIAANDGIICQGASADLTASGGFNYLWSNGLGTNPTVTVTPSNSTTYIVTVTDAVCSASTSFQVVVSTLSGGGIANYTSSCGIIALAGGGNGDQFLWQGPGGYSSSAANATVSPAVSGVYTLTMSNIATGCSAVVYTSPNINVLPGAPFFNVTGGGAGCSGEGVSVGLDGSQTFVTYQLLLNNAPIGSPLSGTGSVFSFGNQTTAGTYTVLATAVGCPPDLPMNGSAVVSFLNCDDNDPCTNDLCSNGVCSHTPADADGDGVPCGLDCDDNDPDNFPDNTEICDGQDNDCDVSVDEGCDDDGDDWCDAAMTTTSSAACPNGGGDCNDNSVLVYPGAPELCDGVDNDCDGEVDENLATTYFFDQDSDGYGDDGSDGDGANAITVCITPPPGYITQGGDCDDGNGGINPAATEICNGFDDDCDGDTDEGAGPVWFTDTDGDGFGNPNVSQLSCSQPSGYVSNNGDCDDGNGGINPTATEVCNGVNDDCDGPTDEDAGPIWYADADGDGFGNAAATQQNCSQPTGYVANDDDCNDGNGGINPAATEVCNGLDDDCDGQTDESGGSTTYYQDLDGDGFGNANVPFVSCAQPTGFVTNDDDCNDAVNTTYPGAPEVCDGIDNDCNLFIDETLLVTYFFDQDGDGFGNPLNNISVCTPPPPGYLTQSGDCDDGNGGINPAATEICNGFDDDCDGLTDETAGAAWYADTDNDGFGDPIVSQQSCSQPMGYVGNANDCNDANSAITNCDDGNPCTMDACVNGACTNTAIDADSDGIPCGTDCNDNNAAVGICNDGNACTTDACTNGACVFTLIDNDSDGSPCGVDCNDNVNTIFPGAPEICDGLDNDCDGAVDEGLLTTYFFDQDGDSYGNPANSLTQCIAPPPGFITQGGDCNDGVALIFPGAPEICDGLDNDCDGLTDETSGMIWYADADGDGFGNPAVSTTSCTQPSGYVANNGDCNDTKQSVFPGAPETCNGLDDDCDGLVDEGASLVWYPDWDMDGYGDSNQAPFIGCTPPNAMYSQVGGDCQDEVGSIHPNAPETCNYLDDDCDGMADEGLTFLPYYDDHDGDGYGEYFIGNHCTPPANSAPVAGDCNNWNSAIYPGATEVCNNLDDDCDGAVDEGVQGTFYQDSDGDGYGNSAITAGGCSPPNGFVTNSLDCNDGNGGINPAATEACNTVDDDCDGLVNEGLTFLTYYSDNDHDGYGQYLLGSFCAPPANSATLSGDCNDWNAAIKPGALEICNWQDDDCDGLIDEGIGSTWYRDLDGDTYGNPAVTTLACFQPLGYVANSQDCNDNNANIKPGATEVCDGVDNNCDGQVDNVPTGVDLIVQSANAPSSATAGTNITVSGVIKNLRSTTAGVNKVRWYLSNDQTISSGDYSPTSGTVWNTSTNTIATCATKAFSKTVTLPSSGWNGTKYLIFKADGMNNISETNENNNLLILSITINPAANGGGTDGRALAFAAHKTGRSVSLQWLAKFEQNVTGMQVERSADGLAFERLMEISSTLPATAEARTFEELDHDPLDGDNFYRIRFQLEDGSEAFSDIRQVHFEPLTGFDVYPNPAKEWVEVNLEKFAGKEGDLLLSNSLGQVLWQQHLPAAPETPLRIDLSEIAAKSGLFQVTFVHLGKATSRRLVVVRED